MMTRKLGGYLQEVQSVNDDSKCIDIYGQTWENRVVTHHLAVDHS